MPAERQTYFNVTRWMARSTVTLGNWLGLFAPTTAAVIFTELGAGFVVINFTAVGGGLGSGTGGAGTVVSENLLANTTVLEPTGTYPVQLIVWLSTVAATQVSPVDEVGVIGTRKFGGTGMETAAVVARFGPAFLTVTVYCGLSLIPAPPAGPFSPPAVLAI